MNKELFSGFGFSIIISVLILTLSGGGLAQISLADAADESSQAAMNFMTRFDNDKDGKVSNQEFPREHFKSMDKNGDGYITVEEANLRFNPPKHAVNANQIAFIVKFDKDKDGKLSNKEFTGRHFSDLDKNGDGFIEAHEAPEGETAY
jgi:Ca2+-binding EF-hand superfamily protein